MATTASRASPSLPITTISAPGMRAVAAALPLGFSSLHPARRCFSWVRNFSRTSSGPTIPIAATSSSGGMGSTRIATWATSAASPATSSRCAAIILRFAPIPSTSFTSTSTTAYSPSIVGCLRLAAMWWSSSACASKPSPITTASAFPSPATGTKSLTPISMTSSAILGSKATAAEYGPVVRLSTASRNPPRSPSPPTPCSSSPAILATEQREPYVSLVPAQRGLQPLAPGSRHLRHQRSLAHCRQHHREYRSSARRRLCLNGAVVLLQVRHYHAQPQPCSTSRSLRGEERIENLRQCIGGNSRPVVLEARPNAIAFASQSHSQGPARPDLPDRLLRVDDQVQEHLHQLVRVAHHVRQRWLRDEVHRDIVQPQRVLVQLQAPLHHVAHIQRSFPRSRWTRKEQQVLHHLGRASCLLLQQFEPARDGGVRCGALQQFHCSQDRGERIVQLVRKAVDHLPHGGESLALDQLLLHLLLRSDVPHRRHHPCRLALRVEQRARGRAQRSPCSVAVLRTVFR